MSGKGCDGCDYFVRHDTYDFFGVCKNKDRMIKKKEMCEGQKDIDIERLKNILKERGWIYCLSCGEPIFTVEELDDHKKGSLTSKQFSDDIASEDSPAAD